MTGVSPKCRHVLLYGNVQIAISVYLVFVKLKREGLFFFGSNVDIGKTLCIAPGENFSKSILRELDGCDLFLLLVTPNLLEPSNYVRKVEYKRAKDAGKRIIAIEAEKTDKAALRDAFAGLTSPVGMKQSGAIFSVLTELLRNKKIDN